ncbi:Extracellular metalloprotease [Penicillium lagena]|uniref:Extracellular metalloprotease n=1 Tax=Penicillium lagena TaxID=94218 RepID=UPI002540095C|nr:Extracellular metalloprotease [Penicillium lagena]KAJ5619570.1 Extracellular metalloprotease [Penicillium lagena]
MAFLSFFQLVALSILFLQAQYSSAALLNRGICATEDPDESLLGELQRLKSNEAQSDPTAEGRLLPIEIDTWFHIIRSEAETDQVSQEMVAAQLSILQYAYMNTTISYRLQGVTWHVNDTWARNEDELGMKRALRQGSYQTLNVYFQTDLEMPPGEQAGRATEHRGNSVSSDMSSSVLGFCTLPDPSINIRSAYADYVKDGCNILAKTMPGGSLDLYNRGGTAIHEIGHWNGLLHTFQGESCSPDNAGDYIGDTPQQSTPTDGCPARKDSCPDSPGLDAIHDFMDYSSDVCYESFTPGQGKRMRSMWAVMRAGK